MDIFKTVIVGMLLALSLRAQDITNVSIEKVVWSDTAATSTNLDVAGTNTVEFSSWGEMTFHIVAYSLVENSEVGFVDPGIAFVERIRSTDDIYREFVGMNSEGMPDYITSWLAPQSAITAVSFNSDTGRGKYVVRVPVNTDGVAPSPEINNGAQAHDFWIAGANDVLHQPDGDPAGTSFSGSISMEYNLQPVVLLAPTEAYAGGLTQNTNVELRLVVNDPSAEVRPISVTISATNENLQNAMVLTNAEPKIGANELVAPINFNLGMVHLGTTTEHSVTITATLPGGLSATTTVLVSSAIGEYAGDVGQTGESGEEKNWCYWTAKGADSTNAPPENCSSCTELNTAGSYGACPKPKDTVKRWYYGYACDKRIFKEGCFVYTDELNSALWKADPPVLKKCTAQKAYWVSSGRVVFKSVPGKKRCCKWVHTGQEIILRQNCKN